MIELAMEAIDRGGEVAVRVAEIAKRSGTAITSIYHHFGSRDGLVEAAQTERIVRSYREGLERFRRGFGTCRSRADFRDLLMGEIRDRNSPGRARIRLARVHGVGAVLGRPRLAKRVGEFLDRIDQDLADLLADAQRRGWIRAEVDPLAASQWFSTVVFGRVLGDIGRKSWNAAGWLDITVATIDFLLLRDERDSKARPVRGKNAKAGSVAGSGRPKAPRGASPRRAAKLATAASSPRRAGTSTRKR